MLFYVLLLLRLSVARAAPALDEEGCDSDYAGPQRSEDVGAPAPIIYLRRSAAETDLRGGVLQGRRAPVACKSSPRSTSPRNLKNIRCFLVSYWPLAAPAAGCKKLCA